MVWGIGVTPKVSAEEVNSIREMAESNAAALESLTHQIGFVPCQKGNLYYTGAEQSPEWTSYDSAKLTIGGTTSATDAGTFTATFTPVSPYTWSDGTADAKAVDWSIKRATLILPSQSGTLTYTGAEQSPVWADYDSAKLTIGGTISATDAGTYTATFTPKSNYCWHDGIGEKSADWSIKAQVVALPSQDGELTYTGAEQSPVWTDYDSAKLTIGGVTSATDAGTYTATFTPKSNYCWHDGTTVSKSVTWQINGQVVLLPIQSGSLTYNGAVQTPSWTNFDQTKLTIGGTTSATNAGAYIAKFTPKPGYIWDDGTNGTKSAVWHIEYAEASISISPAASLMLTDSGNMGRYISHTRIYSKIGVGAVTASATQNASLVHSITVDADEITVLFNHLAEQTQAYIIIEVRGAVESNYQADDGYAYAYMYYLLKKPEA